MLVVTQGGWQSRSGNEKKNSRPFGKYGRL
jgi:hypothetical protein